MGTEVETVLHEQLGVAQEEMLPQLGVVAQELMQQFEEETSRVQHEVVTIQQNEIQALRQEIDCVKLQQEITVHNVETTSSSSTMELRSIIAGL